MAKPQKKKANGTNSVYKTKDGAYVAQIVIGRYDNGNPKYKRFKSSKQSEVVTKMNEFLAKRDSSVMSANVEKSYLEDFLLSYVMNIKAQKLKPMSFDRELISAKQIIKYIGKYKISELTPEIIIIELVGKMKQDGYSFSSTKKNIMLLNQCLKYALLNRKISENPCDRVPLPSKKTYTHRDPRFFNDEEISKYIEQACKLYKNGSPVYKYGMSTVLVIYTGLRGGELTALKWRDIDFEGQTISVRRNIIKEYDYDEYGNKSNKRFREQDGTKTDNGRVIPMNIQSLNWLNKLRDKYGDARPDDYVATGSQVILDSSRIGQMYHNIATAAGIDNAQGIHALRHTFASLLIRRNIDIKILSEILGHKDVAFTYNVYVHLIEEQKAKAMKLLDLSE